MENGLPILLSSALLGFLNTWSIEALLAMFGPKPKRDLDWIPYRAAVNNRYLGINNIVGPSYIRSVCGHLLPLIFLSYVRKLDQKINKKETELQIL